MKQLLLNVLNIQSESYNTSDMENFIMDDVNSLGLDITYDDGNMYVTKGTGPYPCIVSHTDTVHKIIPKEDYTIIANDEYAIGYDKANMSVTGCGGDDKVGIYICLQLLRDMDNIKVAFFRDEEVGCVGSYKANVKFFDDVRFVLQCDRKGNSDFVNNIYGVELQSKKFKKESAKIIKKYGYKPSTGMLTDVYALTQMGVNVSVANMSCGYYNPHSDDETVVFADVENCLAMCYEIMKTMTGTYKMNRPKSYKDVTYKGNYQRDSWSGWGGSSWNDLYDTVKPTPKYKCDDCQRLYKATDLKFNKQYWVTLCEECEPRYPEDRCDECGAESRDVRYFSDYNMTMCKQCSDYHQEILPVNNFPF